MDFYHRKLLLDSVHYGPTPSPLQSPRPLPVPPLLPWFSFAKGYHINHSHLRMLEVVLIALACTIGVAMFLYTTSRILRYYYSRRNNRRRRNTPSPILFDIYGNSPSSDDDDDEGPVIDHPVWFIRTVGLEQSIIDSIAVFKFRKGEGLIEGTECSVCLGEFQEDESLRLLPKCSHAFHVPCIDTWLRSHKNCPLCRAPVVHDAGRAEVSAMVPDSNSSGQNQETEMENLDSEGSGITEMRIEDEDRGDNETPDKILHNCDKMNSSSSVLPIDSKEVEEEIQPVRRSVSMDSFSGSLIFHDVVDSNCDFEGSETHFDDEKCSSSKDVSIAKQGSGGSSTIYKLASIGKALQKRTISSRFSQNRNFLFSTHCRSQSSTLPL